MIGIGDKLSGRYHILKQVGQGGMANVYLAHDLILDRDVAVKVLRFDFHDDQNAIERFRREAMSASQLLHHNIVEVYDVNEENDQQYIVMEYVDGEDLKTYIRENKPLSLELAVSFMSQILAGIEIAHENGIIHRDIKPQNILLTSNNEVKITDFGIAVALSDSSITQTNTLLGSVHYLSPEQARGGSASEKSDIYALGVVLYELITGEVPFDGESAVSIALKHFQEPFPKLTSEYDYVPQSLENVVMKATCKDPDDRYESVGEMLADLSTCLSPSRMYEAPFQAESEVKAAEVLEPIQSENTLESDYAKDAEEYQEAEIEYYDEIKSINRPQKRRRLLMIVLIIVLVILLGVGGYLLFSSNVFSKKAEVPDVSNVELAEAEKMLKEAKLELGKVENDWDDIVQPGNIIESKPAKGEMVEKGSSVDLVVSSGRQQVKIDNYVGQDYEPVRRLLIDSVELIVDRKGIATNDISQDGKILGQSLEPGTSVVPGKDSITMYVGTYSESSTMQDFENLPLEMVENFADEYGLVVDVSYTYSDYIPEGNVVSQDPRSGHSLGPGDIIAVEVSMGSETEEYVSIPLTITVEYISRYSESDVEHKNPLPNEVTVFIGDDRNNINQAYKTIEIEETTDIPIVLTVKRGGFGQYRIMRDGEIVEESNQVQAE